MPEKQNTLTFVIENETYADPVLPMRKQQIFSLSVSESVECWPDFEPQTPLAEPDCGVNSGPRPWRLTTELYAGAESWSR